MARETIEKLVDDIDGSEATATVTFSVDDVSYVIDLNDRHQDELRAKLGPFVDAGRRVRGQGRVVATGRPRSVADKERNSAIREWALNEGVELPSRGRIAGAVQQAYDAKDGDALRTALGLELVEDRPRRGRRRS